MAAQRLNLGRRRIFAGESAADVVFDIVNTVLVAIMLVIFAYPLIYVLNCSFSDAVSIWGGEVLLFPKNFNVEGYRLAFENSDIWRGYLNSLLYTASGTTVSVGLSLLTAYPLSRRDFMPRNVIMFLYVFCMYFGGGLIPTYLVVKSCGMIDTVWALIIPGAVSTWNVILIRTYFQGNIPAELYEAASIDGCSHTLFFLRVVLPLSSPIIAVMVLFTAVGFWNSYFNAMIYLTSRSKFPLQLILREILVAVTSAFSSRSASAQDAKNLMEIALRSANLKYACIVISSLPVMVLYPFVQRYFVTGIMVGAVKS